MNEYISPGKEIAKMTAWVILFSMVIPAVAIALIFTILKSGLPDMIDGENLLMVTEIITYAGTIALLISVRKKLKSLSSIKIGREKPTPAGVVVGVVAGGAGEGLAVFLLTAIVIIFQIKDDTPNAIIGTNVVLQIITVCICPPILEEYAMRSLLFAGIRRYKSFFFAAVYSSVVFALLHMNAVGTPWYFVIGLILAYVYEKKHSLLLNIIIHAAINLSATLLTIIPNDHNQTQTPDISQIDTKTLAVLIVAGLICAGIVVLCMYYFKKSAVPEGDFYAAPYSEYAGQVAGADISGGLYPGNAAYKNNQPETYIFKNGAYYKVDMKPGEYIAGVGATQPANHSQSANTFQPANISPPDEDGCVTVHVRGSQPVKIKINTKQS